jgi:tetratricopeptide (TPR) repeat protein
MGLNYYERIKFDEAIAQYRKALEIKPNYVEAQNNLGVAYFRLGDLDKALAAYQKTIEIKPDYARGYFNVGSVYLQQGKMVEATASFEKALEINPKYGEAHYYLAWIDYKKKDYKSAIQHCDLAGKLGLVVDPAFLEALKPYREGAKK